jgi:DNA-directed RNA polymerase specialized sigma24 family protein
VDADALVEEVVAAAAGDETAWARLWQAVEPRLYGTLRRPRFLGRLSDSEDDCRNIVVEVMGRLRANDFARLRTFTAARREQPGLPFMAWLLVVAKRAAIDYMRAHEEYVDRRHDADASSPGAWRVLDTLIANSRAHGARPAITDHAAAHEILERAADLPPAQRAALGDWLAGKSFAEMAGSHGLADERAAERAVRAALERLRRQFREP